MTYARHMIGCCDIVCSDLGTFEGNQKPHQKKLTIWNDKQACLLYTTFCKHFE